MSYTRSPFDLPVAGVEEYYLKMPQLKMAFDCATVSDPETAIRMGEEMRTAHYIPGMIAYAHFLYSAANISMPRAIRYQTAEQMLAMLNNYLDISAQMEAELAVAQVGLYGVINRPVACLAAMMKSKRLGVEIAEHEIEQCRRKVKSMDVNRLGDHPCDAYDLACELDLMGAKKLTELFYQLAVETEDSALKAKASLALADFYDKYRHENPLYPSEAKKYYQIAADCGFPDVITW